MSDRDELFPMHDPEYRRIYEDEAGWVDASEERYERDELVLAQALHDYMTPHEGSSRQPEPGSTICLPCEVLARHVLASDWVARVKAEAAAEALEKAASEDPPVGGWTAAHPLRDRADRIRSEAGIKGGDVE